jgi:predicted transcriptional regulator
MKVRKLRISIRDFDETLQETAQTIKAVSTGKKVRPKGHRLFFTSPEALRRFLTPKRIELIRLIRKRQPNSINELAGPGASDFKRVYEDVMSLTDTGLIAWPGTRVAKPPRALQTSSAWKLWFDLPG